MSKAPSLNLKGDKLVSKRVNEKYFRIKCSTLSKLLTGFNPGESVYDWHGNNEGQEEFKVSDMMNETESIYTMVTDKSQVSTVTIATNQLGLTVPSNALNPITFPYYSVE